MSSTTWSLLMMLAVLAAIPVVLWLLKRLQTLRPAAGGTLQLNGQLALGPRERVVLVQVGDRELVLGVTPQQITLLAEQAAEIDDSPRPARPADTGRAFTTVLRNLQQVRRQP